MNTLQEKHNELAPKHSFWSYVYFLIIAICAPIGAFVISTEIGLPIFRWLVNFDYVGSEITNWQVIELGFKITVWLYIVGTGILYGRSLRDRLQVNYPELFLFNDRLKMADIRQRQLDAGSISETVSAARFLLFPWMQVVAAGYASLVILMNALMAAAYVLLLVVKVLARSLVMTLSFAFVGSVLIFWAAPKLVDGGVWIPLVAIGLIMILCVCAGLAIKLEQSLDARISSATDN